MRPTLLILRPEPGASATAARAGAAGFATLVAPLFVVRPCEWAPPAAGDVDAVILTSANAVRHAGPALAGFTHLPAYAVGAATAAAAQAAGFAVRHVGEADAVALAGRAAADGVARALHLAGREHRALACPGLSVETRTVYAADAVAVLPPIAMAALGEGAIALLHSPRAASLFRDLAEAAAIDVGATQIAAISPAARDAAGAGWRATAVAEKPTDDALLAAAARLCDQGAGRDG